MDAEFYWRSWRTGEYGAKDRHAHKRHRIRLEAANFPVQDPHAGGVFLGPERIDVRGGPRDEIGDAEGPLRKTNVVAERPGSGTSRAS